jgi:hypothetical protein
MRLALRRGPAHASLNNLVLHRVIEAISALLPPNGLHGKREGEAEVGEDVLTSRFSSSKAAAAKWEG